MPKPTYSLVVPVYNSVASLAELCERVGNVFAERGQSYEILLIDDASPNPETWPAAQAVSAADPNVKALQLMRNFGRAGAILCGFEVAQGEWVLTMDDDLEHLPETLPDLLKEKHHDVVMARFPKKNHGPLKRLTSRLKNHIDRLLLGRPKGLQTTGLMVMKAEVAEAMLSIRSARPVIAALLYYCTRDVVNVTVPHGKRREGRSGFTMRKRWRYFLDLIFGNSSKILRWMAGLGFLLALGSFGLGVFFLVKKLAVGIPVPGWASLFTVLLFSTGMILLALGILGEYLARLIGGVEQRPPFIVRRKK